MAKKTKKAKKKTSRDRGGLSRLQDAWESREPWSGGGGWKPPDGNGYEGRITNFLIAPSQAGNDQIDWTIMVESPEEFQGKEFHDYQQLQSKENLNYIEGRFATLGIKTSDDINELGESGEAAVGLRVRFDCWHSNEFFNMRITDVLEGDGEEAKAASEPEYTKKDIKKMDEDELTALAKEQGLDPDDYDEWDDVADALIEDLGL